MPRDLTDLMERATSLAPPEPYTASDITDVAARRLRRRQVGLAGALAVAVVATTGIGYGVTRDHASTPQPAGPWKYGQTISMSSAVPASSLPGYHLVPWTVPSVQRFGPSSDIPTLATYRSIDAQGRLITVDLPLGAYPGSTPVSGFWRARLYDHPGRSRAKVQAPSGPGDTVWLPTFLSDGRLLWLGNGGKHVPDVFHVTDRRGGNDVRVDAQFSGFSGLPGQRTPWVLGDKYWFLTSDQSRPVKNGLASYDLYSATFAGAPTEITDDAIAAGEAEGTVAWMTRGGQVMAQTPAGGGPFQVRVPFDQGCSASPRDQVQTAGSFVVGASFIAMTERCGTGHGATDELLVFDLAGREIVHSVGLDAYHPYAVGDTILIAGADPVSNDVVQLRYDLRTASLAVLTAPTARPLDYPHGAGDYVLWYDAKRGYVARIPQ